MKKNNTSCDGFLAKMINNVMKISILERLTSRLYHIYNSQMFEANRYVLMIESKNLLELGKSVVMIDNCFAEALED